MKMKMKMKTKMKEMVKFEIGGCSVFGPGVGASVY